jgi:hypothetical protein
MSSLVLTGDTSGQVTLAAPAVAGSNTLTLQAATATNSVNTLSTAVASTSGTSITFSSIPSWVKRITVMFNGVSTNGSSIPLVQLGSGSPTTSGYISSFGDINGANTCGVGTATTGINFAGRYLPGASSLIYGNLIITNLTSNIWTALGAVTNSGVSYQGGGGVTLSGTLDRVIVTTTNGTDTFDAGSINILYEG